MQVIQLQDCSFSCPELKVLSRSLASLICKPGITQNNGVVSRMEICRKRALGSRKEEISDHPGLSIVCGLGSQKREGKRKSKKECNLKKKKKKVLILVCIRKTLRADIFLHMAKGRKRARAEKSLDI